MMPTVAPAPSLVRRADTAIRDAAMELDDLLMSEPLSATWPSSAFDGDRIEDVRERLRFIQEQTDKITAGMANLWADLDRVTKARR